MWKWLKSLFAKPRPETALDRLDMATAIARYNFRSGSIRINPRDYSECLHELDRRRCIFLPSNDGDGFQYRGLAIIADPKVAENHFHFAS
jgi:hypothetical protein